MGRIDIAIAGEQWAKGGGSEAQRKTPPMRSFAERGRLSRAEHARLEQDEAAFILSIIEGEVKRSATDTGIPSPRSSMGPSLAEVTLAWFPGVVIGEPGVFDPAGVETPGIGSKTLRLLGTRPGA